jgi:hypothetical protein
MSSKIPPPHGGLLELIRQAKDSGNPWADGALAQVGVLTGRNYVFVRYRGAESMLHEIEVQP